MDLPFVFVLAWVLSVGFSVLVAAGIITYIRRTLQLMRAEQDGSPQERMLDGIDHVQTQLYLLSERMERMERHLAAGESGDAPLLEPEAGEGE